MAPLVTGKTKQKGVGAFPHPVPRVHQSRPRRMVGLLFANLEFLETKVVN